MSPTNDFEFNVQQRFTHNDSSSEALLACGVWRILKSKQEREQETITDAYFGEIGTRYKKVSLKVIRRTSFESQFGTGTLLSLKVVPTNEPLKWFASSRVEIEEGDTIMATFTVKKHTEYKNRKETMISRLKQVV